MKYNVNKFYGCFNKKYGIPYSAFRIFLNESLTLIPTAFQILKYNFHCC